MTRSYCVRLPDDLGPHPSARVRAALQITDDDPVLRAMRQDIEAQIVSGWTGGRPKNSRTRKPVCRVLCSVCGRETAGAGPSGLFVRRHERIDGAWCPGGAKIGKVAPPAPPR